MKAHQRIIRERKAQEQSLNLFSCKPDVIDIKQAVVREVSFITARAIILEYEWIGTMPLPKSCRFIFGLYFNGICGGVIVYVEPSTRQFNADYPRQVVQLNRGACIHWTPKNSASFLISKSTKILKEAGIKIVIAYCTIEAGEYGTIYQALSWWYIGKTKPSKTYFLDNHWISERTLADKIKWAKNKSPEWLKHFKNLPFRYLDGKFKYVKFLGSHRENKLIIDMYAYKKHQYPKRPAVEVSREIHGDSISEGVGQFHDTALLE